MAYKTLIKTGNWSDATCWGSISNTPTLHATTNLTISTSSYFTAAFTAPNTTNNCLGAILYLVASGASTGGTINVTLQQNYAGWVDTAATVSYNVTEATALASFNSYVFFKFPTPFLYTSTTAGYYRFKITRTGTFATAPAVAMDSGGTLPSFLAVDDRTGLPAATDDVFICGSGNSQMTVTLDGDRSVGSGSGTKGIIPPIRTLTNALSVGSNGVLTWDTAKSSTLTITGHYAFHSYSSVIAGTEVSPFPSSYVAKIVMVQPTGTLNFGGVIGSYPTLISFVGVAKSSTTLWRTNWASGLGTAASPLITQDNVDWSVGDEIVFCPNSSSATNYNETEVRFIITKNAANSYVLSNTKGGAESALLYSHGEILNLERNVILSSDNPSYGFMLNNQCLLKDVVIWKWVRANYPSYGGGSGGFQPYGAIGNYVTWDYCVMYNILTYMFLNNSRVSASHTGLIFYNSTSQGINFSSCTNKTFNDCYFVKMVASAINTVTANNNTYNRCKFFACVTGNSSTNAAVTGGASANKFVDCEIHCTRHSVNMTTPNGATFVNCLFGTKGKNANDINNSTDVSGGATFINCSFVSDTLITNYLTGSDGTEYIFHNYNGTTNKHFWYTNYGSAYATGAGLTDTNVRTANSLALKLAPENLATGVSHSFKILAKANSAVSILGFIQKNAAFGSDPVIVDLYLPNSLTPDVSQTMPNDTNWNVFNLAANYTGAVDLYATVVITAKSTTAGAYCYVDDLYNGTNKITALDVWDNGKPSEIMFEQLGDASAVWQVPTSTLTTSGTIGNEVTKKLGTILGEVI